MDSNGSNRKLLKLRREAVQVLAQIGPPAKEAVPILSSLASRDDDAAVRLAAADALDSIIVTPEQATGRIVVAALSDPDPAVAAEAVASIARLDKNAWFAAEGFAKLREMQADKDPKPEVRQAAQQAIEAIEKSIKAAEVVTGLASKDARARALAKRKLEIVKKHPAVKKAFLNAITDFKLDEQARETLRGDYERTYPPER